MTTRRVHCVACKDTGFVHLWEAKDAEWSPYGDNGQKEITRLPCAYCTIAGRMSLLEDRAPESKPNLDHRFSKKL